ncbi:hypothetical protein [Metallibacterium scheffleri]|uniref:hypothetical protein n=1 Tax=Metallibacterium scheffleri TaxID=993689 RepID=UPI0023F3D6DD|nr:hypothetical protein [Metallibacterium scheffleri]
MATKKTHPAVKHATKSGKAAKRGAAPHTEIDSLPFKNLQPSTLRPWSIEAGAKGEQTHLVTCSAQMSASGGKARRTNFTVPSVIRERLDREIVGAWTSAMVVLVDWALDQLKASGQQLVIRPNAANAVEIARRNSAHAAGMQRAREAKKLAGAKKNRVKADAALPSITGPVTSLESAPETPEALT